MNAIAADELSKLITGADYWTTQPNASLGLASVRLADGPHGLRVQDDDNPDHLGLGRSLPATCFPTAVTLSSTWDVNLIEEVGAAIGAEARTQGVNVVLGPGLNLKRSPLCGRNFEYYSEDPLLSGRLAAALVRGIQSNGVGACLKHFAVNNQETERMRVSAEVDERTLRQTYLRTFQIAIRESNPWMVMCSYNSINGVRAAENPWLLTTVLRHEWNYDGVVVSDWGAVRDPVAAVEAGLDLRMPGAPKDQRIAEALANGTLDRAVVGQAIARLKLLGDRVLADAAPRSVECERHHALARRAAAEAAVLLKNDARLLPLSLEHNSRVALIGELARSPRFQGAGSSAVNPTKLVTILDAFSARLPEQFRFAQGYQLGGADDGSLIVEAVSLAKDCDTVVLVLGLPPVAEAEGADRTSIELPDNQISLLRSLARVNPNLVVALTNGSVVTTNGWRSSAAAILEFWLGGQAQGEAVVDVLFGGVNPSGKLSETIPLRLQDTPAFLEFPGECGKVRYAEGRYVGYRWFDARAIDVDYPFGHGLSYTEFAYSNLSIETFDLDDERAFVATFTIANTGSCTGAEVAQVYVAAAGEVPELRGFSKCWLQPGESVKLSICVTRDELSYYNLDAGWVFEGGEIEISIGSSSRDLRLKARASIQGVKVDAPLSLWSPLGHWFDHPVAGPLLDNLLGERGGIMGRLGDLLSDPTGQDSARGFPMITVTQFPGVPFDEEDMERILEKIATSQK